MTTSCKYVVIFPRLQRKVVKIMKQNTFNQWKREKCFHLSANHFPIMQTVCLHFPVIVYRKHSDRYTVVVVVVFIVISDSCVTDHRTSARVRLPPITQPESSSVRAISEREIKLRHSQSRISTINFPTIAIFPFYLQIFARVPWAVIAHFADSRRSRSGVGVRIQSIIILSPLRMEYL